MSRSLCNKRCLVLKAARSGGSWSFLHMYRLWKMTNFSRCRYPSGLKIWGFSNVIVSHSVWKFRNNWHLLTRDIIDTNEFARPASWSISNGKAVCGHVNIKSRYPAKECRGYFVVSVASCLRRWGVEGHDPFYICTGYEKWRISPDVDIPQG